MSGFEKQTYTQVPNSLFEQMKDMDECELKVVMLICRYTFGYHRDEIKLSTRKIAEEIGMNTASVDKGADAAVKRGLVERITDGNKTTVWRALVSDSEIESLLKTGDSEIESRAIQKLNRGDSEIESQVGVKESIKKESNKGGLTEKDIAQANAKVDAILDSARKATYAMRDKMPEPYLPYCDKYVELTGQQLTKRVFQEWMLTFQEWLSEGLSPADIAAAYKHANRPEGGFLVGRPGSLTNTAVALKSQAKQAAPQIDRAQVEQTRRMLEEKEAGKRYVPPPAEIRARLGKLTADKSVKGGM